MPFPHPNSGEYYCGYENVSDNGNCFRNLGHWPVDEADDRNAADYVKPSPDDSLACGFHQSIFNLELSITHGAQGRGPKAETPLTLCPLIILFCFFEIHFKEFVPAIAIC
jgi:hypothetical protein